MKATLILLALIISPIFLEAQPSKIESKSCGYCGKSVSKYSKIGQKCPHCGVVWGRESINSTILPTLPKELPKIGLPSVDNSTQLNSYLYKLNKSIKAESAGMKVSKVETEKWILSKLKLYSKNRTTYGEYWQGFEKKSFHNSQHYDAFKFINNTYFQIAYHDEKDEKYIVNIPLYEIEDIMGVSEIEFSSGKVSIVTIRLSDGKKSNDFIFKLAVDSDGEVEISERLCKAFYHLKKFYVKPKSTEPF